MHLAMERNVIGLVFIEDIELIVKGLRKITKSVHPILATMLSCIRAIDARF
jgi:hypothetical protein